MSDENPNVYRMPRRVNDPILLFIFPVKHVMPLFIALVASIIMGNTALYIGLGLAWFFILDYIDTRYQPGYLFHRLWWMGLTKGFMKETKTVPDAMKREFHQ